MRCCGHRLSPDGQFLVQHCRTATGLHRRLWKLDGAEPAVVLSAANEAWDFSPDSRQLAYVALLPEKQRVVVVNGKPGKQYPRIFEGRIVFDFELDFEHAGQEIELEYAHVSFLLSKPANVRIGSMLMPVGYLNELHEPLAGRDRLVLDVCVTLGHCNHRSKKHGGTQRKGLCTLLAYQFFLGEGP